MANTDMSHQTATGNNALTFTAGSDIVAAYASGGFAAIRNKAVKITGDKAVGLTAANDRVYGSITAYDDTDGASAKVSVQHAGQIPFRNAAAGLVPNGRGVKGGATAGEIALCTSADPDFGVLTSSEGGGLYIVVPR